MKSKIKILKRQFNSKDCIVCGMNNDLGLKTKFYELENGDLCAVFTPLDEHQSYPNRLHGGISSAILDETIGRAIAIGKEEIVWGVTIELNVKYKKPVPLNEELIAIGHITNDARRIFEGTGKILLPNGETAVEAHGRYMKMPVEKIAGEFTTEEWRVDVDDSTSEIMIASGDYKDEKLSK